MTPADQITEAEAEQLAVAFDAERDCRWNFQRFHDFWKLPELCASKVPQYSSLGDQCWGSLVELALLHTLRPCKNCGGEYLYKSGFQIACCSCLGDHEECEDCQNGGCRNCAENMNLPDAITRWSLNYGDDGPRGRVKVIG